MASMACPQCSRMYAPGKTECPTCRIPLLESLTSGSDCLPDEHAWQHTPWGRIAVGLFIAQGLSFGFDHLLKAGTLAGADWDLTNESLYGIYALRTVQAISLLFASVLLGAGLMQAVVYGSLLGLVNGLVAMAFPKVADIGVPDWLTSGIPILHLAVGAVGAGVGRLIWKPPPQFAAAAPRRPLTAPSFQMPAVLQGPFHPIRVTIATFLLLWGALFAKAILRWIINSSNGLFQQQSGYEERILTYQLIGLIALFAGGLAGSNTFNGLKQGLSAGVLGAVMYFGMQAVRSELPLESIAFVAGILLLLGTLGGLFGGQLFPPVAKHRVRRSVLDY